MADNTIDTLMLEVESNAEKSADGLDRLAASLAKVGKSVSGAVTPLSSFASSIKEATAAINSLGSTREISSLLSQLTQLSRIRLDNLENKKIRIDFELNGVESGQLKYAIQKAIDGVKVDTSSISKQLAQSFNLSKEATAKLQSQMQTIANSMATSFDGKNFHLNDILDSALEEMAQNIRENGSVIQSSLNGTINEYKEFYDYFNTHKIYISDYLKADIGKTEFAEIIQQNLNYITRNAAKGIELNSVWEELSSKFPTLIPPGITNAADQVVHVLEEIRNARDQIKPIAIDDLVSSEQTAAMNGVWQSIMDSTRNLSTVLSQRIKDATEYAQDKINLDVKVNEEKIIQDIRNAINRASSAQYDPVKVKLSVDSKNIQNSVSQELKGVDPGNLPQISEGMEKIANAMVLMNGVKFKDTGLSSIIKSLENLSSVDTTKFNADGIAGLAGAIGTLGYINFKGTGLNSVIKSLRELSSIDMSNFNTDSFSGIVQSISSLGQIPDISAGINKLVASLAKLASSGESITIVSQHLPVLGDALRDVVNKLSSLESVSESVNLFVQSLARLAGAGSKAAQTAAGLEELGNAVIAFFNTMREAPQISENTLRMVEALSRLASSGANVGRATSQTSNAFNALGNTSSRAVNTIIRAIEILGKISTGVFGAVRKTFTTSAKIIKTTAGAIAASIQKIINAMKAIGSITEKAFSGMLSTVRNVASGILSAAKSIVSSFTLIGTSGKVFSRLGSQLRSIMRIALPFTTIWGAINLTKQSVELSSNLTEIQNVVRTTFGDMTQEVNDFAKSAVKDLGMSELTFKQIASRYQAMGTAMGISSGQVQKATKFLQKNSEMYGKTADSMGDMSIELTRLAADMASFYDVDATEVADKLSAIFTGQARPLRSFGIDLTEATLKEWALKNGMDANIKSMSQAEKTLLRYQYVLAQTGAAQGDFQKTILTWANQSRILKESFKQVGSIIGEVIINAIKPFVIALNSALGSVISFTRTVADALGKIFGWTIEIDAGGVVNDMEDAADSYDDASDSAEDVADGTGDAADAAKKLKKQLAVLPFDELNQLAKDMEYAADAGKGSGGNGDDLDDLVTPETSGLSVNLVKGEGLLDQYKSDIDSLYKLGDYIGTTLTETLKKINWDKIYESASGFGSGLASFLNGLISPELFSEVGNTIAGALNTIMHGLDSFGRMFDWTNFGTSLASGIKSFLSTYDWDLRVDNFNTFANGILDTIIAALGSVTADEWRAIPQKISDMLYSTDVSGISWKLGKIVNSMIGAFNEIVSDRSSWQALSVKISEGVNSFLDGMNIADSAGLNGWQRLGASISNSLTGIVSSISGALMLIKWDEVGQAIADCISGIDFATVAWHLGNLGATIANALYTLVSDKNTWSNLGNKIADGINGFFRGMNTTPIGSNFNGWQLLGQSITGSITGILTSITTALQGIHWEEVGQAIVDLIGGINFGEIGWNLGNLVNSLVSALQTLVSDKESWASLGSGMANGINNFFSTINWESVGLTLDGLFAGIVTFISNLAETGDWEEIGRNIGTALSGVDWGTHLLEAAKAIATILGDLLKGFGSTTAGKWIIGIGAAFTAGKLATTIYAFVDGIATIIGGDRNTRILTRTMENLLGSATESAATTASTAIGGVGTAAETAAGKVSLLQTGLMAIGGAGVLAGIVLGTGELAEFIEKLRGGNGQLSELGGTMDRISSEFSPELQQKIFELKEELENTGASSQEWATSFAQLFTNAGVSADTLSQKYTALATTTGLTAGQQEMFSQVIDLVAQSTEDAAERVETSGIKTEDAYDGIRDSIGELVQKGDLYKEQSDILIPILDSYEESGSDAGTAFSNLSDEMDAMGLSVTPLINELKNRFPDALRDTNTALGDLATNAENAATATDGVGNKTGNTVTSILGFIAKSALMALGLDSIKSSGEEAEGGVSSLNTAIGTFVEGLSDYAQKALDKGKETGENYPEGMATGIEENGSLVSDAGRGIVDDLNEAVQDEAGIHSPSTVAKGYGEDYTQGLANGVKGNDNEINSAAENVIGKLNDAFSSNRVKLDFKNIGSTLFDKILSGMSSMKPEDISNQLSTLISNIKSVFNIGNDMYSLGQSVGQSFANGLQSIHIKAPRMYISEWERHDLGNGAWMSTPRFSVQWLARGGLVTGLTSAILGENGRNEAVLPLESPRAMKAISAGLLSGMQNLSIGQYRLASLSDMAAPPDYSKAISADARQMRNTQIDNSELMDAITSAVVTGMMNNQQNPINVTCYAELKTENDEVLARAVTRGQKSLDYRYNPTPKFGY